MPGRNKVRTFNMKNDIRGGGQRALVQIVVSVALALIIYLAVRQAATDETTVGGFVSFSDCVAAGVSAAAPP